MKTNGLLTDCRRVWPNTISAAYHCVREGAGLCVCAPTPTLVVCISGTTHYLLLILDIRVVAHLYRTAAAPTVTA